LNKERNPRRLRSDRIEAMAMNYAKHKDKYHLWEMAKEYQVTHKTARDYVDCAIILSKKVPRLFPNLF